MAPERSGRQRLFAALHIVYEISTMVDAALRHRKAEDDGDDPVGANINLESALLHARNLIEFLATRPRSDNYMRPEDFAPGWERSKWSHLASQLGALNVLLTHLDWNRLSPEVPTPTRGIFHEVLEGCRAFAEHVVDSGWVGGQPIREALDAAEVAARPVIETSIEASMQPLSTTDTTASATGLIDPLDLNL